MCSWSIEFYLSRNQVATDSGSVSLEVDFAKGYSLLSLPASWCFSPQLPLLLAKRKDQIRPKETQFGLTLKRETTCARIRCGRRWVLFRMAKVLWGESTSSGLDVGAVPGLDSGFNADKDVDVDGDTGSDGSGGSQVESGLPDADRIGDLASSGEGSSFDAVEHGESASSSSTDDACRPCARWRLFDAVSFERILSSAPKRAGGAGFDSSSVALFASDMSDGQKLRISYDEGVNAYRISIEGTDLVLSALGDENANGRTLRFLHDEGDPLQRWLIEGSESDAAWMELHPSNDTKASVDVANAEAAPVLEFNCGRATIRLLSIFSFLWSIPCRVWWGAQHRRWRLRHRGWCWCRQVWMRSMSPALRVRMVCVFRFGRGMIHLRSAFRFSFDDATGYYRIENLLTKKKRSPLRRRVFCRVGLVQEEPSKDDLRQAWAVFKKTMTGR